MIYAPSFPLQFDDTFGYQGVKSLKELSRFHLTNLIMTNPGEKISDSTYGVGIKQFLFENATLDIFEDIRFKIRSQVNSKLGYITLINVNVGMIENYEHVLRIRIFYSVDNANLQDVLNLNIDANSGTLLFADSNY